jgi:hypothetical protein
MRPTAHDPEETGLRVQRRPCSTCIYRPGCALDLAALEDQIRDPRMPRFFQGHRICHHSADAVCAGFWARHAASFTLGQLALRLGLVRLVEDDRFTERPTAVLPYHPAWIFVGEQRSPRAQTLGVTWQDRALCSKTLHEALEACGVTAPQHFVNVRDDTGRLAVRTLAALTQWQRQGVILIALGQKVQRVLRTHGLPYVPMVHPAARGKVRARAAYHAHVASVMQEVMATRGQW